MVSVEKNASDSESKSAHVETPNMDSKEMEKKQWDSPSLLKFSNASKFYFANWPTWYTGYLL